MIYFHLDDLLHTAERTLAEVPLRDGGLLESALARPRASAFGKDAHPIPGKPAASLPSIARNQALVDGNKRLALAVVLTFYGLNGTRLTMTNEQAYDLVIAVAADDLDEVGEIARRRRAKAAKRRR